MKREVTNNQAECCKPACKVPRSRKLNTASVTAQSRRCIDIPGRGAGQPFLTPILPHKVFLKLKTKLLTPKGLTNAFHMQEGDDPGILCTLLTVKLTRIKKVTAVYSLYELERSHPGARGQWKERNGFENFSVKRAFYPRALLDEKI